MLVHSWLSVLLSIISHIVFICTITYELINDDDDDDVYVHVPSQEGPCRYRASASGATVSGYVDIPCGDEAKLQEASATVGPISVAIDANHGSFQHYKSG